MQLQIQNVAHCVYTVQSMTMLDTKTTQRLHSLGIQIGSQLQVLQTYPFHGPVIIQIDDQKIALREAIFKILIGGH